MRAIGACVVCSVLLLLTGCPGEKPGSEGKPKQPGKARFSIEGLPESTTVLNGNQVSLKGSVKWSSDNKDEVQFLVSVEPEDQGVTARVEPAVIKPTDKQSLTLIVAVGESAASGDYKVKLVGKTSSAGEASQETTINVPKKE